MSSQPNDEFCRPFKELKKLLKQKKVQLACQPSPKPIVQPNRSLTAQEEANLFREAVADVTPLFFDRYWHPHHCPQRLAPPPDKPEQHTLDALYKLVEDGQGFVVAHTAEYMEATGPGVGPEIARQLHQGRFAIQGHVDLHGLTAAEAQTVVHKFIGDAIKDGKRTVLVVHGRGLTSPDKPVLKNKVYYWLTRGPLRKHVIALTSARPCDGGTGATYVLLRRQPMTKRMRKAAYRGDGVLK